MLKTFYNWIIGKENPVKADIREGWGGTFILETRDEVIGTYSRRRDAVRGANRRGLTLA